jgi:TolB-like protein/Tfp pilus assembly protein PilF
MAEYLDISPDTYGAAEAGRPILKAVAAKIAHKLELEPSQFLIEPQRVSPDSAKTQPGGHQLETTRHPVIAVTAFSDLSSDGSQAYFCDGLTEELIHLLSQIHWLRVVARTSVFEVQKNILSVAEIGRRLGASHIVRGGVRAANKSVRITVQLVDAGTGLNLWSQRFDREAADILAIQEEIAAVIIQLLGDELRVDKFRPPIHSQTSSVTAYTQYLQGLFEFHKQTAEALDRAIDCYKRAVDEDPEYASSYVGLADCYCTLEWYGLRPSTEVMPLAKEYATRALNLNTRIAAAHCVLAVIKARYEWDWNGAEQEFRETFTLNPSLARAHFSYALDYLTPLGRLDEALQSVQDALLLDPLSPILHTAVGGCYYRKRLYSTSTQALTRALQLNAEFYHAHWSLARSLEQLGQHEDAVKEYEAAIHSNRRNPMILAELGHCYGVMGRSDCAEKVILQLEQIQTARYLSPLCLFFVNLGLSRSSEALESLAIAAAHRTGGLISLPMDPRIDPLRKEPKFQKVLSDLAIAARTG